VSDGPSIVIWASELDVRLGYELVGTTEEPAGYREFLYQKRLPRLQ
jgi:hypothetical protein